MRAKQLDSFYLATYDMCIDFANQYINENADLYLSRNHSVKEKVVQDIVNGKLAEWMIYYAIKKNGGNCSYPDMIVYPPHTKDYSSDLILTLDNGDKKLIHVKSHNLNSNYPVSWLFQPNDPLVSNPASNDYIALCVIDGVSKELKTNNSGGFYYSMKAIDALPLYKNPVRSDLNKKVIYYKDL
jgi:hypothetical protein